MRLVPTTNRMLIEPLEESPWTGSGLFLPYVPKEKPRAGTVLAVGPDVREALPTDVVFYDRYSVTELRVDGVTLVMAKEPEVIAKVLNGSDASPAS